MNRLNLIPKFTTFLFLGGLILHACTGENEPGPTQVDDDPAAIAKSAKRGLSYDLKQAADLDTLKSGVSWWYNWYHRTEAPENYYEDYQMEFIPMLWGRNAASDFDLVKSFILDHPEVSYLLVMNEPNLTDQLNMSPEQAATEWVKYETLIDELADEGRTVALVGPAMNWGTLANYSDPVVWLDAFYDAYHLAHNGEDPLIDYLAFHWYDYGLESQLDRLQKYGKQIWITEMANWNANIDSYIKHAAQMTEMVHICETRDDVFRYAWFIGRGAENRYSNLFDSDPGELNMLGELYISLPYSE
ncbi:MAG: glycoside hydrolase family protein [Candidatus Marinimicrobia bacterium]|nr:glycoside hydrolase family protein [Candidatus Neomarinimicrobiota bacterium]MCF7850719.1 glycoside hydrolase family protein [Candidatus Neomarinimicrobiota bacterium]